MMDKENAAQTINITQQVNAMLNMQLFELQKNLKPEEFEKIKKSFGVVMGQLFLEITNPLYKAYPSLAPEYFGGTAMKVPDSHFIQVFDLITSLGNSSKQTQPDINMNSLLKDMIARGKQQGFLTYEEVKEHLPKTIIDQEQIDDIVAMIEDMGVRVTKPE